MKRLYFPAFLKELSNIRKKEVGAGGAAALGPLAAALGPESFLT